MEREAFCLALVFFLFVLPKDGLSGLYHASCMASNNPYHSPSVFILLMAGSGCICFYIWHTYFSMCYLHRIGIGMAFTILV
jgi:hypothetical protein